ncbi:hypothetical protein [Neobacillus sp. PS3-40]|uniref:hypothetical protein n=1 Tax=Neobacillus sp. PS3-40 TaxID=3070679 RepID=UPI0027E03DCF|nr:hypothetical protein [Neobacillus sp. PS3-40]WML43128.1 hypothetical protein RCG20_15135 [Neobacillus sp. PS3-40]
MNEFGDLIKALQHNNAYDTFYKENKAAINEKFNSLFSIIQEGFSVGFEAGRGAGYSAGVIDTNVKMLFRLVDETNLSDEEILTVLDKQGEDIFIEKLGELRNTIKVKRDE